MGTKTYFSLNAFPQSKQLSSIFLWTVLFTGILSIWRIKYIFHLISLTLMMVLCWAQFQFPSTYFLKSSQQFSKVGITNSNTISILSVRKLIGSPSVLACRRGAWTRSQEIVIQKIVHFLIPTAPHIHSLPIPPGLKSV